MNFRTPFVVVFVLIAAGAIATISYNTGRHGSVRVEAAGTIKAIQPVAALPTHTDQVIKSSNKFLNALVRKDMGKYNEESILNNTTNSYGNRFQSGELLPHEVLWGTFPPQCAKSYEFRVDPSTVRFMDDPAPGAGSEYHAWISYDVSAPGTSWAATRIIVMEHRGGGYFVCDVVH